MSATLEAVWQEALKLPPDEQRELRKRLSSEIQASLVDDRETPLWDEIDEIIQGAPPGTWDNVPTDGSINTDHYLYGATKK